MTPSTPIEQVLDDFLESMNDVESGYAGKAYLTAKNEVFAEATQALQDYVNSECLKARIDELRMAESMGDPILQEKYFDDRIKELRDV